MPGSQGGQESNSRNEDSNKQRAAGKGTERKGERGEEEGAWLECVRNGELKGQRKSTADSGEPCLYSHHMLCLDAHSLQSDRQQWALTIREG